MSISTTHQTQAAISSAPINSNKIEIFVSDAETQVIISKAKKAGISVNEYIRYAALGFPIP